jgi:hypothetical protein
VELHYHTEKEINIPGNSYIMMNVTQYDILTNLETYEQRTGSFRTANTIATPD